ncbi:hypothetical protein F2Q68_00008735 [Brassica cretica]|uniref:Uncharacterized protein n=1 Tax=Brassica cretica TaxID=69181 RepID=A0A8S9KLD4_BRACR|nr:hypothetical protein F2Q68_00008735 [Brassica cretica]
MEGLEGHDSSTYSTMLRDSQIETSPWIRTGTFLWIGLDLRKRSLFEFRTSASSMYSYSTPQGEWA